jgi:hypothetical protein
MGGTVQMRMMEGMAVEVLVAVLVVGVGVEVEVGALKNQWLKTCTQCRLVALFYYPQLSHGLSRGVAPGARMLLPLAHEGT